MWSSAGLRDGQSRRFSKGVSSSLLVMLDYFCEDRTITIIPDLVGNKVAFNTPKFLFFNVIPVISRADDLDAMLRWHLTGPILTGQVQNSVTARVNDDAVQDRTGNLAD
jgi:hypothetical protein